MEAIDKAMNLINDDAISNYQIYKETGIAQSKLSNLKSGNINPDNLTYQNVMKLADYYDQIKSNGADNMNDIVLTLLNDSRDANINFVKYLCKTNGNYRVLADIAEDYLFNLMHNDSAKTAKYGLYINKYQSKRKGTYYKLSDHKMTETIDTVLTEQQIVNITNLAKPSPIDITITLIKRVLTSQKIQGYDLF